MQKYLDTGRNNVDRDVDPNSMLSQGDFPTKVETQETRPRLMDVDHKPNGCLAEGVSFCEDLYEKEHNEYGKPYI